MTEVPEHLLKRSKERRAAMGGGGDADDAGSGGDDASESSPAPVAAASAPATAAPTAPAVVEEAAPPPPPPPYVEAALRRRRIPYWVMPVLAFLPVWAYIYQGTLEPAGGGEADPIELGATLYTENRCSDCHGSGGGGGVGPAFTNGAIYQTWPEWEDHFRWVRLGSGGWPDETYGANARPLRGGMPAFEALSDAELLLIVNYERAGLGGEAPDAEADALLAALAEAAALHPEADFATLLEEAAAILAEASLSTDDISFEGEGSPELE